MDDAQASGLDAQATGPDAQDADGAERPVDGPGRGEGPADAPETDAPPAALSMRGSFGTALGGAMFGFEQALRRDPPAEILAAEHMPERGYSGDEHGLVIHIPEPQERT